MSRMFGLRCSSQASATDIAVAPSRSATAVSASDCSGVKPPRGKKGMEAMPAAASSSISGPGSVVELERFGRLTFSIQPS